MPTKCCDNCIYYRWYYDHCDLFDCEVDARSMCAMWKPDRRYNETH